MTDAIESPAATPSMEMFTFDDLLEVIAEKQEAAQEKESWSKLASVAENLAALNHEGELDLIAGRRWALISASIMGYRGVLNGDPLQLQFSPEPGITVLHGLNGAGKSSISDAIELGLSGQIAAPRGGTAGNAQLWEPVALGRGVVEAKVELVLASEDMRLYLTCSLSEGGAISSRSSEFEDTAGRRPVELGPIWAEALTSHQPVFAYATLERRVQLSKDLAGYFENLLALGGCFAALKFSIEESGQEAGAAFASWKGARDAFEHEVAGLDHEWLAEGGALELPKVVLPEIDVPIEDWIFTAGLTENGIQSTSVSIAAVDDLAASAKSNLAAVLALKEVSDSQHAAFAVSLQGLHDEATALADKNDTCPVCGTDHSGWLRVLSSTMSGLETSKRLRVEFTRSLKALEAASSALLLPIISLELFEDSSTEFGQTREQGERLVEELSAAIVDHGYQAHSAVSAAAAALSTWIESTQAIAFISEAVSQTDRLKQWRIARTLASTPFVSVWREQQAKASEARLWASTAKRVEDLRKHLRERRTRALEGMASNRVQSLLADVGLTIDGLSVSTTKASMKLVDQSNSPLELGMLSAGQRNAVLLAPLLASVDAGPFGFLLLDDPVHAFDELRIDRLAEALAGLAVDRRVIVLTHDERLKEHLVARAEHTESRLVSRSNIDGSVSVESSGQFWVRLLEDAGLILELTTEAIGTGMATTDAVRGLCRQGVDNALREFTIRNAITHRRDLDDDLRSLDEAHTTAQRLKVAEAFWVKVEGDTNPVTRATSACSPYLDVWNHAVHGDPAITEASKVEIKAARAACKTLTRTRHK